MRSNWGVHQPLEPSELAVQEGRGRYSGPESREESGAYTVERSLRINETFGFESEVELCNIHR